MKFGKISDKQYTTVLGNTIATSRFELESGIVIYRHYMSLRRDNDHEYVLWDSGLYSYDNRHNKLKSHKGNCETRIQAFNSALARLMKRNNL